MDKRIFEFPEATELQEDDVMLIDRDGAESAKSILASKVAPALMSKTITERGTYKASDDDVSGYYEVDVDIPYTDIHVATGAIASFEGEDLPVKSLKVNVDLVQSGSGDPSPENVRPFVGWSGANVTRCGKNLLDTSIKRMQLPFVVFGGTIASNVPDGSLMFNSGTYTISVNKTINTIEVRDNPNSIIKTVSNTDECTFTLAERKAIKIALNIGSQTESEMTYQIEVGSSATTYEPYNGHTYSISFGQTVYEGTLDVTSGTLMVNYEVVDLGSLSWTYTSSGNRFTSGGLINLVKYPPSDLVKANIIASSLKAVALAILSGSSDDNLIAIGDTGNISVRYTASGTDATAFTEAMSGVKLVYELATPITIQLTPTMIRSLAGDNNIFSDTGDVDVEYQTVWVRPSA